MRTERAVATSVLDAKERIVVAAERLIAERGAAVPLRDIAVAAQQRNNSAVQYHFGSRDGLIEAVVAHRVVALEAQRAELLAEHEAAGAEDDVRTLLRILVRPMLEVPYRQGATHYARFLEHVRSHPALSEEATLTGDHGAATRMVITRLGRVLREIPEITRLHRLRTLPTLLFALLADQERATEVRSARAGGPLAGDELIDMLAGMLTAPSSGAATRETDRG